MSNKIDYTPVILAQLTDLATRVTQLEAANQALRDEVSRLNGGFQTANSFNLGRGATTTPVGGFNPPKNTFSFGKGAAPAHATAAVASVPMMRPSDFHFGGAPSRVQTSIPLAPAAGGHGLGARQTTDNPVPPRRHTTAPVTKEYKPLTIQDVLHLNETVTMEVGIGKDAAGNFLQTTCVTTFDGVSLTVTACELVPSLVGMSTTKPGEILYRFIEDLKNNGHVKKPFTIAPWRLCFVERNGKKMSLEELR